MEKKRGTVQKGSHTSPHHTFIILVRDLSQQPWPQKNLQYVTTKDAAINYLSMLPKLKKKKKTLQSTEHICVVLAGSEEKETNLAGYLV